MRRVVNRVNRRAFFRERVCDSVKLNQARRKKRQTTEGHILGRANSSQPEKARSWSKNYRGAWSEFSNAWKRLTRGNADHKLKFDACCRLTKW